MVDIPIPPDQGQPGDSFELEQQTAAPALLEPAVEPGVQPEAPGATGGHWSQEDHTFDGSDIEIRVMLFRADQHPAGRLVQIVIQNFEGTRESGWYREQQLTSSSKLDELQSRGINEVFQRFWFLLEEQRKKAAAPKAKSIPVPASPPTTVAPPRPVVMEQPTAPHTQQLEFF